MIRRPLTIERANAIARALHAYVPRSEIHVNGNDVMLRLYEYGGSIYEIRSNRSVRWMVNQYRIEE